MTVYLPTFDIIVEIHELVLDVSGGRAGIHVANDIHRAAERPVTYTSYVDQFDIDTICAVLIDSIARYHGFNDGNKRTALMTAMATYRINGYHFKVTLTMNKQFDFLVMWVVKKKPEIPEIEARLKRLREKFGAPTEQSWAKLITTFVTIRLRKEQKN